MPSLFVRLRSVFAPRKPNRKPSPKRKTPSPRRSPSVKLSGALGHNWYGGRQHINKPGPLMRMVRNSKK